MPPREGIYTVIYKLKTGADPDTAGGIAWDWWERYGNNWIIEKPFHRSTYTSVERARNFVKNYNNDRSRWKAAVIRIA